MLALLALLARSARPFLVVPCSRSSPLTSPFTSRSLSLLQHRLGRSHSLAQLAPSYSSLALARRPLRSRSPLLLVACSRSYNMGFARNRFSTYNIVLARIRFTSYYLRCSYNMVLARNRFRSYNNVLARIRFTSYDLRSHARPARSPSLATLAPSYLLLALARRPLRQCSPSSFSLARSARPFPSIRFSFFILHIPFLSYKFYPLLIDRCRSYPRSIPLAHSLARMLAKLAPCYLSFALARRPLRKCSPCSFSFARSARPCPSMCFSFFILNTAFLSYQFYPFQFDRSRSYPRSHARPARSRTCPCSRMCHFILNFRSLTVCT